MKCRLMEFPYFAKSLVILTKLISGRKKKNKKKQWCWTMNGFYSLVSVL